MQGPFLHHVAHRLLERIEIHGLVNVLADSQGESAIEVDIVPVGAKDNDRRFPGIVSLE
jgi:hypothetical protein